MDRIHHWMSNKDREMTKDLTESYMLDLLNKIKSIPKLSDTAREALVAEVYVCHSLVLAVVAPLMPLTNELDETSIEITVMEEELRNRLLNQIASPTYQVPIEETKDSRYFVIVPKEKLFTRLSQAVFNT